jgi:hypothetical protein
MTDEELTQRFDDLVTKIAGLEERLIERMRDMQTELLCGFEVRRFRLYENGTEDM